MTYWRNQKVCDVGQESFYRLPFCGCFSIEFQERKSTSISNARLWKREYNYEDGGWGISSMPSAIETRSYAKTEIKTKLVKKSIENLFTAEFDKINFQALTMAGLGPFFYFISYITD